MIPVVPEDLVEKQLEHTHVQMLISIDRNVVVSIKSKEKLV